MSWSRTQVTGNATAVSGTTLTKAYASNLTIGSELVCTVTWYAGAADITITVGDGTQSWTATGAAVTVAGQGGNWRTQVFHFSNNSLTSAPTVTVTFSAAAAFAAMTIVEYTGLATSALDKYNGNAQVDPGNSTDAVTSGAVTTTTNGQLIVCVTLIQDNGNVGTAGTGFTSIDTQTAGGFLGMNVEEQRQTSAGSITGTFTAAPSIGGNADTATVISTFKEPSAGNTSGFFPLL